MTEHDCSFPEIEILQDDGEELKRGMKVLVPCPVCGEEPRDNMDFLNRRTDELNEALVAFNSNTLLFHWSPRARRKQIERYGLRPSMRASTSQWKAPYVCFADSPSWAWALSGNMRWTPSGDWDLWSVWMRDLKDPVIMPTPDRPSGLYEVRTEHRVYKSDIWWVGSRVKEG